VRLYRSDSAARARIIGFRTSRHPDRVLYSGATSGESRLPSEIVHAQGLVHGKLTAEVIMTDASDEPDFQLSGFEWSLWSVPTLQPSRTRR
jgi:hypothetical protein